MSDLEETLRKTHGPDVVVMSKRAFTMIEDAYPDMGRLFEKKKDASSEQVSRIHLGKLEVKSHGLSWCIGHYHEYANTPP